MTAIQPFDFHGRQVRVHVNEHGEPWWVAKDVCTVLGLTNPTVALERLDQDERAKLNLGRQGETNIVNEPGLYSLVLASRKPEAREFKRWVTHEVLPAIRKHGGYAAPTVDPQDKRIAYAKARMEVLALAKGIMDPGHLDSLTRIVAADAMGITPQIEASAMTLDVTGYLREKGLGARQVRRYAGSFGKRLKGLYVATHGREPGTVAREINGGIRNARVYTEADRALFDQVWNTAYAGLRLA